MKLKNFSLFAVAFLTVVFPIRYATADELGTLIFTDDFERNESQEVTEEIGQGWNSNSQSRAKGNKQVDLKDGAMHISFHESADHAVSVTHPAEFQNGSVTLRFMLENEQDSLGLNFADLKFKEVHAGHLCMARFSTRAVHLDDLKTGKMANEFYELKKAKNLTPEQQQALRLKVKRIPNRMETGKWYVLKVTINGETLSASLDGVEVGSFSSAGIAHPTKRTLRLSVPGNAVIDDIKIYSRTP